MRKFFSTTLFVFFLVLNLGSVSKGHPQPFVFQEFFFEYEKEKIELVYKFHLNPIVINEVFPVIDTDNSGIISEEESVKFANETVLKNLSVKLNGENVGFRAIAYKPIYKLDIISIENFIEIDFVLDNPTYKEFNSFEVKYNKKFLLNDQFGDLFYFEDNTKENSKIENLSLDITTFAEGEFKSNFKFVNSSTTTVLTPQVSNSNSIENKSNPTIQNSKNIFKKLREKSNNISSNFFSNNKTGLIFIIGGFLIAFVAGSLHAITPGHGKSMMAAFLLGKKKSSFSDILVLGASITLAHTSIIFILGFIFLALDKKFSINNILPYFEKFSAVLLILLGFNLLRSGYKNYKHNQKPHSHFDENIKIQSKKDLFFAGISGGVIPCTDAFSFLTYFVGISKVAYGLIWVFFFSLGLAVAILVIGSFIVFGKGKINQKSQNKFARLGEVYAPALSGLIILILAINLFI